MNKSISFPLLLLLSLNSGAQTQTESPERIQNFILDPTKEIRIPVSKRHATVIYFPKPVQGVIGFGLTDGKELGTFQFSHPQNSHVITVRNVMEEKDCYMTCLMDEQPYVFHLVSSEEPVIALKLHPLEDAELKTFKVTSPVVTYNNRLGYSTASLIQSIRKARSRAVWEQTYPEWYESAKRRQVKMVTETTELDATITEIHQFPVDDTLVFLGQISNKTEGDLWLQPQALHVRVGERLYPAQMVDFTGEIEKNGKATFAMVLRGNTTGSREHLSINNEFRIVMPEPVDPSFLAQSTADLADELPSAEPTILPEK